MPIYDRPTKVLMHEFAEERLAKGQEFQKREAVRWFAERYPNIKGQTVQLHVEGMAINAPQRKHHPNIRPGSGHDLFFKLGPNRFRLWNRETDPAPLYRSENMGQQAGVTAVAFEDPADVDESEEVSEQARSSPGSQEFAFERDLRNYLAKNLGTLESGLALYEDEDHDFNGIEFPVGGRFIDILAIDARGVYVVIELKVSRGYDRTVGQLLRYMAWVKKNLASGRDVRGIIVAREISDDLRLATSLITGVLLFEYELSLKLKSVSNT